MGRSRRTQQAGGLRRTQVGGPIAEDARRTDCGGRSWPADWGGVSQADAPAASIAECAADFSFLRTKKDSAALRAAESFTFAFLRTFALI
ncbi:hypothetical protein [Paenibacillus jilunlii]|uniref:Uncharacterized protein n=1 Tax=Paenibacillus jilunlii TaxID=682956 RepID=A0ABR5ST23_9BACL|nr:hypothetical protein [Paenibacillus jilunlii]KWX73623.1 hypothetical protein AML91_18345 [Paenibacillus jilunlii]